MTDRPYPPGLLYTGPSPFSGHKLDKAVRCPTLWALDQRPDAPLKREKSGYEPVKEPLVKGTLGHTGFAQYYRRMQAHQQGTPVDDWTEPIRAIAERAAYEQHPGWMRYVEVVQPVVQAYMRNYASQQLTVHSVEESLPTYTIKWDGGSRPHTRSADLVVRNNGRFRIIDHKCVMSISPRTIDRYVLSGQFLDYRIIGEATWGDNFDGVWLNLAEWPRGDKAPKFIQIPVQAVSRWTIRKRMETLSRTAQLLDHLDGQPWTAYPARLEEQVCNGPYGLCPGRDLCVAGPTAGPS